MKIGRRRGRILAFQALYAWDTAMVSPQDLLSFQWVSEKKPEELSDENLVFSRLLFLGTIEHADTVDNHIKKYLKNWDFHRITKVDKAILRLGTYSLLFQTDTDPKIVINESVNIARDYGTDDSFRFVNAVLDSIKKECLDSYHEKSNS